MKKTHQPAAPRVVTIDGPAGSGKSTVARALARRLGFLYVDTGAMYRALTWLLLRRGVDWADARAVAAAVERLDAQWEVREGAVVMRLEDEDPGAAIRSDDVTKAVSGVAAHACVRSWMAERQRALARLGPLVMEGRDIGSVVFPDAAWRFYLDASPAVRASRRLREMGGAGSELARVAREIERRDALDSSRGVAPLQVPAGARVIDTSALGIEEVVEVLERWVRR